MESTREEQIGQAWQKTSHPVNMELYSSDETSARMVFRQGQMYDLYDVWLRQGRRFLGVRMTGLFLETAPAEMLHLMLQTAVDQFDTLAQVIWEGNLFPEPRLFHFVKDDSGIKALRLGPLLAQTERDADTIYSYDRTRFRIERMPEFCSESQEGFRLVEK